MNKTFKKILSVTLALLVILPMALSVFAVEATPITPEQTQEKILEGIVYKDIISVDYTMDDYHGLVWCYMDIVVQFPDGTYAKYTGDAANFVSGIDCARSVSLNTTAAGEKIPLEKPVTMDEAVEYACKAFCVSSDDITLLSLEEHHNYDATHNLEAHYYEVVFSIGFGKRYKCLVYYDRMDVSSLEVWVPNSFEGKINLFFQVLVAKIKNWFSF